MNSEKIEDTGFDGRRPANRAEAWLDAIKIEALERDVVEEWDTADSDDEALIRDAARGMARRRLARGDVVGALLWSEAAGKVDT